MPIYHTLCDQFPEEARYLQQALEQHSFLASILGEFLDTFEALYRGETPAK